VAAAAWPDFSLACLLCLAAGSGWLIHTIFESKRLGLSSTVETTITGKSLQSTLNLPQANPVESDPQTLSGQNFLAFYENLGERHFAEQQLKTIFALAQKNGLKLDKGQYKLAFDKTVRCIRIRSCCL